VGPAISEVLLLGAEAQASIIQTGLALLKMGKSVLVAADAVGAHRDFEKQIALSRLEQKGAEIVSVEMVVYEWLESRSAEDIARITQLMRRETTLADGAGPAPPLARQVDDATFSRSALPLGDIGQRLRRSRNLRGLTLKEVAAHCQCSSGQLSKIENNKALPSLLLLQRLSEVLGSDMRSLLDR
jgi:DNA-binding XRE family transcriptional regulator